ncbi:MAG: SDR family oxidoreductase [Pseudomonadales bacterium]
MGTYVITGGASGIGAAVKQQLESEGHNTVIVDIRDADVIANLATDEGRGSAIESLTKIAEHGLDGFVACAGVGSHLPDRALITEVNYYGTINLIEGLRGVLAKNGTPVVLISSNSAPQPTDQCFVDALLNGDKTAALELAEGMQSQPVYSGTKQAMTRWMRRNTQSYAALGVRMNAVAPGYTQTPLSAAVENDPTYGDAIRQFIDTIPVGRPGQAQDMANAVSYLLSDKASFVCGSMLFVDGGHDALHRPDQF